MEPRLDISDQITAGYHGTSLQVAEEIRRTHFKLSAPDSGAYLGEGVYFFNILSRDMILCQMRQS
jgi:hypothetical protein